MVGSLTGVVASKSVRRLPKVPRAGLVTGLTECNGIRALDWEGDIPEQAGNWGHSDPADVYGNSVAQRIKGTPGITG